MQLVDEEHDLALGVCDLLQDCFQPFLELASKLRAGRQARPCRARRCASRGGPRARRRRTAMRLRQALDDRRLSDAGLADEHRVVLRPPRQHLDHAADFVVAADHRIELALPCDGRQVAPVPFEGLILPLGMLIGHALRPTDARQRVEDRVLRRAGLRSAMRRAAGAPGRPRRRWRGTDARCSCTRP